MSNVLYRFRSTNNLLGNYKELENQEIYFADPEQLNDPMEGYKDIFWAGDAVVWENLLKHYLRCLKDCYSVLAIRGNDYTIGRKDIGVFNNRNSFPTPIYERIYKEICVLFFGNKLAESAAVDLSGRKNPIRRDELVFHLRRLHYIGLEAIRDAFETHGLIPKKTSSTSSKFLPIELFDHSIPNLFNQAENEHPGIPGLAEKLCAASSNLSSQLDLIIRYQKEGQEGKANKLFLLSEFPEAYVYELEQLVYPDWYAACFMSECSNSSVWGHYGDNHKGICLIFNVGSAKDNKGLSLYRAKSLSNKGPSSEYVWTRFHQVDYEKRYAEIDFFRSLGRLPRPVIDGCWYRDEQGTKSSLADEVFNDEDTWRANYWKNFYHVVTTKLKDWQYEKEYRLILQSELFDFSTPDSRKLKYKFSDLKGVIFGIKTSMEDKLNIIRIIESKCVQEKRNDFKFYQARYSPHSGMIEHAEMNLIKFSDGPEEGANS